MSNTVIKINNLSKMYDLGQVGTGTMVSDLQRWWAGVRGKEDPFLKLGESNDRSKKGNSRHVWALKHIDLEVQKGDVLGIIGKNGAGKSTLLKILSRTTAPTTGEFKVKGRIASLLEVGTGFHPDLTGRENVFLNGAILGMTKAEIKRNFDEIVAFSGVERYIDTPVKRYSSGMYVRLAFAVAAYLESDILIVDEVLAVGDAEFQKKCLGKMKDVSGQGRTVLFVSHNMSSIKSLCNKCLYLKHGETKSLGETSKIIEQYFNEEVAILNDGVILDNLSTYSTGDAKFKRFEIKNKAGAPIDTLYYQQGFFIETELEVARNVDKAILDFSISTSDNRFSYTSSFDIKKDFFALKKGKMKIKLWMDPVLMPGTYSFNLGVHDMTSTGLTLDFVEGVGLITVLDITEDGKEKYPLGVSFGNIRIDGEWQITNV
jgi:lipopolysaccharide transport system ATP-binding protein